MDQEHNARIRSSFIGELVPDWRPTREQVLWTIRIAISFILVLAILTLIGLPFGITLWDWLKLLVVPAVIALGGYLFTRSENRRTQEVANQRTTEDRKLAQERAETDRLIANQRRQDDTLQAYLDQMSQLLLDQTRPLATSVKGDAVRTLARARTLTAIKRLDAEHNHSLLGFLRDAHLVRLVGDPDRDVQDPIIDLSGADLTGVDLSAAKLRGAFLRRANLQGAVLVREEKLETAMGTEIILVGAAYLADSGLSTDLEGADLSGANLSGANLQRIDLEKAADLRSIRLMGTKLIDASLRGTDLGEAVISYATDWTGADLRGANLSGIILKEVDRSRKDAENLVQEEIENAYGDEVTTLPQYLQPPKAWSKSIEEQETILQERLYGAD